MKNVVTFTNIFDPSGDLSQFTALYEAPSSATKTYDQLLQHFNSPSYKNTCSIMTKDIDILKSPATQNMMDIWHQSHEPWDQFVSKTSINNLQTNNIQLYTDLTSYETQFTRSIYAPLSTYISSTPSIFKENANPLIKQISEVYNHLKSRAIAPNCCMQIDIHSKQHKTNCSVVDDVEHEQETDDEDTELTYQGINTQNIHKQVHSQDAAAPEIKKYDLNSMGNMENLLRDSIPPLSDDVYSYKRYEVFMDGMEVKTFEAVRNNTIPQCAFENGPLCMIYNTVNGGYLDEDMITFSFQVYNERINLYVLVADGGGKFYGSRIFKKDLLDVIPLLFEDKSVAVNIRDELENRLYFKPDRIYNEYYLYLVKKGGNKKGGIDMEMEEKLVSFVNAQKENIDLYQIRQCFIDNGVDMKWFRNHIKKDLINLLKNKCGLNISVAVCIKLWKYFAVNIEGEESVLFNEESVERKVEVFVNECNTNLMDDGVDSKEIQECFVANNIDDSYFKQGQRSEFMEILKRECGIKAAMATKLWTYCGGRVEITNNEEEEVKIPLSEENIDELEILRDQQVLREQDQFLIHKQKVMIKALQKKMAGLIEENCLQKNKIECLEGDKLELKGVVARQDGIIESKQRVIEYLETVIRERGLEEDDNDDEDDDDEDGMQNGELLRTQWDEEDEDDEKDEEEKRECIPHQTQKSKNNVYTVCKKEAFLSDYIDSLLPLVKVGKKGYEIVVDAPLLDKNKKCNGTMPCKIVVLNHETLSIEWYGYHYFRYLLYNIWIIVQIWLLLYDLKIWIIMIILYILLYYLRLF